LVRSVVESLVLAIADILESAITISLLSLHLPVYKPERMNVPREVSKNCQTDVNEQITAVARDECCRGWREQDRYNDEDNVG